MSCGMSGPVRMIGTFAPAPVWVEGHAQDMVARFPSGPPGIPITSGVVRLILSPDAKPLVPVGV